MFGNGLFDNVSFVGAAGLPEQVETALQQGNDAAIAAGEKFETQRAATLKVGEGFGVSAQSPARAAALLQKHALQQRVGARGGQAGVSRLARFLKALQFQEQTRAHRIERALGLLVDSKLFRGIEQDKHALRRPVHLNRIYRGPDLIQGTAFFDEQPAQGIEIGIAGPPSQFAFEGLAVAVDAAQKTQFN